MEQKKRRKKKSRIAKRDGFLSVVLIVCALIQILYHSILSGMIGEIGIGYYGVAVNWMLLMMAVASVGIPYVISRLIATRLLRNQLKNAVKMFQLIALSVVGVSIVVVSLTFVFAEQIASMLIKESILAIVLKVGIPFVVLYSFIQILRGYFQSFGTDVPTGVSVFAEQFVTLFSSLLFCASMYKQGVKIGMFLHNDDYGPLYGVVGAFLGMYIGAAISLIFLLVLFLQHYKTWKRQAQKDTTIRLESMGALSRNFVIFYLPVFVICFVVMASKTLDLIIFSNIMESRGAVLDATRQWGVYVAKYQVLLLLPIACITAFAITYVKGIAGAYMKKDSADMKKKITMLMRRSFRVLLLFSVSYSVLTKLLIQMFFKGDTTIATTVLRAGGFMPALMAVAFLSAYILFETGYTSLVLLTTCISCALQVLAFILFMNVGKMHIQGLVLADVVSMAVYAVVNLLLMQRILRYRQEYIKTFFMPFIANVLAGIVMFLLQILVANMPTAVGFIICFAIGSLVYMVCLLILKVVGEEELYDLPGGENLVNIARMCRLL